METVRIVIHDLKANISDQELCNKIRDRLHMGGIQTHGPTADDFKREGRSLVVIMGIHGTAVTKTIEACVTRYLEDLSKPEIASSSSCEVFHA